jgi:hypothetical protein
MPYHVTHITQFSLSEFYVHDVGVLPGKVYAYRDRNEHYIIHGPVCVYIFFVILLCLIFTLYENTYTERYLSLYTWE